MAFRSICFRDDHDVELGSRNERPLTRYFPEVVAAALAELPDRCVIDGEIVVATDHGLDFEALQQRIHPADSRVRMLSEKTPAAFIAFDLLALGDDDLTSRPFTERRAALVEALDGVGPTFHVTPATTDADVAQTWFSDFEGAGLDGVIAKPFDVTYQPDKRVMFKVKHERTADCVVAGYRVHKSGPDAIGSLMLGLYTDSGSLASVGVIGAFPMAKRRNLFEELQPIVTTFDDHPWNWAATEAGEQTPGRNAGSRWNSGKDLSFVPLRPSESSRCGTTTWRASAFATPRSSTAGGPTAIRARAPTNSSTSPSPSVSTTSSRGWGPERIGRRPNPQHACRS